MMYSFRSIIRIVSTLPRHVYIYSSISSFRKGIIELGIVNKLSYNTWTDMWNTLGAYRPVCQVYCTCSTCV